MKSTTALKNWLAGRTPVQLTALLELRALPQAAGYGQGLRTLDQLADHLLSDASVSRALESLHAGDLRLLAAFRPARRCRARARCAAGRARPVVDARAGARP
ncbi:hypothetical protein OG215_39805 (plasmid) [Streptomyces globisporus]|uniref:hypothetical protein n=1 Tax=Streptomyces globisporus TaxID=1908 RepID=UPI002F90C6CA|nr:hypothetical protein OG215_39805 [Streptomyces globisporus]